ncbi:unnamed protein product, partial [Symbiodinium sp. CCMP2592]
VRITVKWRQLRTRSSIDLDPGHSSGSYELRLAEKFADVRFWLQDMDAEEYVTIDLDHVLGRAYQMREGCPIFVEPDHDLKEGTCTLHIKSALTIYNDTALPLRIMLGPPAFHRWRHQVGDLLRSGTRGLVSFSQTLQPPPDEKDVDDSAEVAVIICLAQGWRKKCRRCQKLVGEVKHATRLPSARKSPSFTISKPDKFYALCHACIRRVHKISEDVTDKAEMQKA